MKNLFQLLYKIFYFICYPFINFVIGAGIPFIRDRRLFELKNVNEDAAKSFSCLGIKASATFEISSEGELEQVRPLIDDLLAKGKKIEIVFCSPSVEKSCLNLHEKFPKQVRCFRLPLVTYNPFQNFRNVKSWMTSSKLILCRYDFFPELFFIGMQKNIRFILVSGTLKNKTEKIKSLFIQYLYKSIYNQFNMIITGTKKDFANFTNLLHSEENLEIIDFRILQIAKRNDKYTEKLSTLKFYTIFKEYIEQFKKENRIIFGSFWDHEMQIFQDKDFLDDIASNKTFVTIIPHELSEESLLSIEKNFQRVTKGAIPLYILRSSSSLQDSKEIFNSMSKKPGVLILECRGILCEIYNDYQNAYVGGGYGKSIHSVLEPYLGNNQVFVGPKVHRSTEFDLVSENSPHLVHIVPLIEDFYQIYTKNKIRIIDKNLRRDLQNKTWPIYEEFITKF